MEQPYIQVSGPEGRMDRYCAAVRAAGGVPVWKPGTEVQDRCTGLLLCGGGDIEPTLYGRRPCGSQPPQLGRDLYELALTRRYLAQRLPVLGICRGMQVLNVALSGTLHQALSGAVLARHLGENDLFHPIVLAKNTPLSVLWGPHLTVNSAHHQGVDRLGVGLYPAAWSQDGVVEGMVHGERPAIGVQFHPERLAPFVGGRLFQWLVETSRLSHQKRKESEPWVLFRNCSG